MLSSSTKLVSHFLLFLLAGDSRLAGWLARRVWLWCSVCLETFIASRCRRRRSITGDGEQMPATGKKVFVCYKYLFISTNSIPGL